MAASAEKLADESFSNWIKSQLAVLSTKEGLVDVVASEFSLFQRRTLQSIYDRHSVPDGTLCTLCKTPNVVPCPTRNTCTEGGKKCSFHLSGTPEAIPFGECPNNLCNHIQEGIKMKHVYEDPCWRNTDATKWCTDEIEICKCFLPYSSYYKSVTQFQDLGMNSILTALISYRNGGKLKILKKARDAVREFRHSRKLSVSDIDLSFFLDLLIRLLDEVQLLTPNANLKKAVKNLKEFDTLRIATTNVRRVLDDALTVLGDMEQNSRRAKAEKKRDTEDHLFAIYGIPKPLNRKAQKKSFQHGNSGASDETSLLPHTERHEYYEEKETPMDIPITTLIETVKRNLPQGDYLSLNELEDIILTSKDQQKSTDIGSRTHREAEQDIEDERNLQNTPSDKTSYADQIKGGDGDDVVDEENFQNVPKVKASYTGQTGEMDRNERTTEEQIEDSEPAEKTTFDDSLIQTMSAWNSCIENLDKEKAFILLNSAKLPDMETLNKLCQEDAFGRKSDVAVAVCTKICAFIKRFSTVINDVWASRKAIHLKEHEKFDIKFVVITEELEQKGRDYLEKRIQSYYDVLPLRDCDQFSSEEEDLMNKKDIELNEEARAKIRTCIRKNAQDLLQKHTYLSVISGCPFRSVGYATSSPHQIIDTPCIVLNVHFKGYIPIDEEPFKSEYDGVKVDVREDAFVLYNLTAKERHDDLKAGCLIGGEADESGRPAGTLGGFVIHPEYGLCGLSCSHTLLSPSALNKISQQGQINWSLPPMPMEKNTTQKNVYQPFKNDDTTDKNKIGQLVKVVYRSGTADSQEMDACGMDVALFQLNTRLPESSDFPVVKESKDSQENSKIQVQFGRGAVGGFAWHDDTAYFSKYGATTGYTVGIPVDYGISCKKPCKWIYKKKSDNPPSEFEFKLHNQLSFRKNEEEKCHILPFDKPAESEKRFAYKGDSGSLMYHETTDGNLVCVGIIEGGKKVQTTCFVTPILPVLKAIGVMEFKNFERELMEKNVKTLVTDMNQVKEDTAYLKQGMEEVLKKLEKMSKTSPGKSDPDVGKPSTSI